MDIGAIIQARVESSRLNNKVLLKIKDKSIIEHIIDRLKSIPSLNQIVIATTTKESDDKLEDLAKRCKIKIYRGCNENVLNRFIEAAKLYNIKVIIRITGDNPLIDTELINKMIAIYKKEDYDYITALDMPLGTSSELVTLSLLEKISKEKLKNYHREHVTIYIKENLSKYKHKYIPVSKKLKKPHLRLTVDTMEDFKLMNLIYERLYHNGKIISIEETIDLLEKEPDLIKINAHIKQKEVIDI